MPHPTISLNGFNLTIDDVIRVSNRNDAGRYAKVVISPTALKKVKSCAEFIHKKAEADEVIYGVTTGFGSKADTAIEHSHAKDLQKNLLRSHACGVGPALSVTIVRAMMVIRLNTLLQGHSGVQVKTVELLRDFLNNEIHPVVPSQGSVGASGDLCPLSHLALPLIGEGEVTIGDNPKVYPASAALKKMHIQPLSLSYKEGIALNNGTTLMTALGTLAVHEAKQLLALATLSSALIFEALCARSDSFAYAPIHNVRRHEGQIQIAKWLTKILKGSTNIDIGMADVLDNEGLRRLVKAYPVEGMREDLLKHLEEVITAEPNKQRKFSQDLYKCIPSASSSGSASPFVSAQGDGGESGEWRNLLQFADKKFKPQDSYSIRCLPQVFGAAYAAIEHVEKTVANELNAAVDNPLIFLEDNKVVSGGNFHGEPIGMPLDYLKLAVAEIGNIVERQINKLMDSSTNDGLPSFLTKGSGLNSGLMITQYVAASLVSENKVLVHPATADSIPTCENTEDHVSMGPIAGRQALEIIGNVKKIVAIAILTGYQGVAMRKEQFRDCNIRIRKTKKTPGLAPVTEKFYNEIKKCLGKFEHDKNWLEKDRYLSPEIKEILDRFPLFYVLAVKR